MFDFRGEWEGVESNHAVLSITKRNKSNRMNVNTVFPAIMKINKRVKGGEQRSILRNSGGLSSGSVK